MLVVFATLEYWPTAMTLLTRVNGEIAAGPEAGPPALDLVTSYVFSFVDVLLVSCVVPIFSGPVSLYLNPLLLSEFASVCAARVGQSSDQSHFVTCARRILGSALVLVFAGAAVYAVPPVSRRLPSLLRYHTAFIPFMITILLARMRGASLPRHSTMAAAQSRFAIVMALVGSLAAGSLTFTRFILNTSAQYVRGSIAPLTPLQQAQMILHLGTPLAHPAALLPACASAAGVAGFFLVSAWVLRRDATTLASSMPMGRWLPMAGVSIALLFGGVYAQSTLGVRTWRWRYDPTLAGALNQDLPRCVDALTTRAGSATRVFLPIGTREEGNDVLLGLVERADELRARAFFQWRYGYSQANGRGYAATIGVPGVVSNAFPPLAGQVPVPSAAAGRLGANFIVAADTTLADSSLTYLGTCRVPGRVPENPGLTGDVNVYAVRTRPENPFGDVRLDEVHRTFVRLSITKSTVLPVSYEESVRASLDDGTSVPLVEDPSGLARIDESGITAPFPKSITVSSSDVRRGYAPLGDILIFGLGCAVMRYVTRQGARESTQPGRALG